MVKEVETTIRCDICGNKNAESHSFYCGRRMDLAGSMENVYYDVDLCTIHFGELVRKHGHPRDYRERSIGRSRAIAYGAGAKNWVELQIIIWKKMPEDERKLALSIEAL